MIVPFDVMDIHMRDEDGHDGNRQHRQGRIVGPFRPRAMLGIRNRLAYIVSHESRAPVKQEHQDHHHASNWLLSEIVFIRPPFVRGETACLSGSFPNTSEM